jgi:hypothetical protein
MSSERIEELKQRIIELKKHWPKHSVSPGLIQQLDDLEEALELEMKKVDNQQNKTDASSMD